MAQFEATPSGTWQIEAQRAREQRGAEMRRMYQRALAGWVQDLLLLRARGLLRPGQGLGQGAGPAEAGALVLRPAQPATRAAARARGVVRHAPGRAA
jgi:hypothetical protein